MKRGTVLFCSLVLCVVAIMFFSQKAEASIILQFEAGNIRNSDPGDYPHTINLPDIGSINFNGQVWHGLGLGLGRIQDHTYQTAGEGNFLKNSGVQSLVTMTFNFDVSFLDFYWLAPIGVMMNGAVFDIHGNLLGSGTEDGSGEWIHVIPTNITAPIRSLEFWSATTTTTGYMAIDDLTISPTNSVPEPTTMLLLGLGLVGLAGVRRKLKK